MKKKRLNNKGMTLIEIIVCFVIVVVIVLSMFKVVNNYKDKQDIESYKNSITTYKNTITKAIWDDIISHKGIVKCTDESYGEFLVYEFQFLDGKSSKLKILHKVKNDTNDSDRIDEDESEFYIQYGLVNDEQKFKFPKMYNVRFNYVQVNEVGYDGTGSKNKGKLFHIYVGIYNPDLQIGDKYNVLDIYTPNVSDYYYALGNY